uniref:Uncharacterized protein n=1 Tax=Nicotiana tabacum TaxID=4097 RepID=A0A1S3ZBG5_TOBAC|nr:PREDICTED: uncharacterized protein LOC107785044 [Nicotiana tabacum]
MCFPTFAVREPETLFANAMLYGALLCERELPLREHWRLVPKLYKNRIWAHIKENTDATEDMRCMLMISVGSTWKEWKHEAKMIGYEPYNNDIECLAKHSDRVEEDQWRVLVHYWSSNEAKMTKKNGVKLSRIEVFKETHTRKNKQPLNEIADETMKEMDELAKVYPELNVPGSASNDVYAQAEQREFDRSVEIEVEKATSAIRIKMEEKLSEAKEEIEAKEKRLFEAKEEIKEMGGKIFEATKDMEAKIDEKVKLGIGTYLESLGITIGSNRKLFGNEQVSDNSMNDHQQSLSPVFVVHTKKVNIIKKTGISEVGTNKKKWMVMKRTTGSASKHPRILLGLQEAKVEVEEGHVSQLEHRLEGQLRSRQLL